MRVLPQLFSQKHSARADGRQSAHALILSLLQQGVDPAVVALHAPQRVEVAQHRTCNLGQPHSCRAMLARETDGTRISLTGKRSKAGTTLLTCHPWHACKAHNAVAEPK